MHLITNKLIFTGGFSPLNLKLSTIVKKSDDSIIGIFFFLQLLDLNLGTCELSESLFKTSLQYKL